MRTTTNLVTRLLLAIGAAGTAACAAGADAGTGPSGGTEPPSGTPGTITGTFRLATHDGNPVPALVWYDDTAHDMDAEMWIQSGSIVLRPDSTYRQTDLSSLIIEGVGEQTLNSVTEGTYSFAPSEAGAADGTLTFRGDNGGQVTCPLTQISITCSASVPGPAGQPDVAVTLVYVRE